MDGEATGSVVEQLKLGQGGLHPMVAIGFPDSTPPHTIQGIGVASQGR